ncbi:MAG TPA: type III secretion system translocon subunit SctE [Buttiauxella sp.]|jgi:hypothetical protein
MSHSALNQALTSQSLSSNSGKPQTMVTSAQVMQFLGTTAGLGGNNAPMAQDVLQLMQHTPSVVSDITRQLTPVVQLMTPRETQVALALDSVSVHYRAQIAQLPAAVARQTGGELARTLQSFPAAQTPEGRKLIRQLQQGRLPADAVSLQQLEKLLAQARSGGDEARLTQQLKHFSRTVPESREMLQKALVSQEKEVKGEGKEKSVSDSASLKNADAQRPEIVPAAESEGQAVARRDGQQQGNSGSQQQQNGEEEEELRVGKSAGVQAAARTLAGDAAAAGEQEIVAAGGRAGQSAMLAISLISPTAQATVSEANAQQAARHVLQNNRLSLTALVQAPLDDLLLQAATLGLKTFSNTADSVAKSIEINGDAQARLLDKKIADYQDQIAKAKELEQKAKKSGFWGGVLKVFSWVYDKVLKPVVDLVKKIPGVEQAFNWIQKNISEIALVGAIVAAVLCPMSLPVVLGLLVTATTAGFSIAGKVMGDNAPDWLNITNGIGDMISGIALMISTANIFGLLSKASGALGKVIDSVKQLFGGNTLQTLKTVFKWTQGGQAVTSSAAGIAQGVIGLQQANLQKEVADIEAKLGLNEMQMNWLQNARDFSVDNLKNILSRSATVTESVSRVINDTGSLRARIAGSIV